MRCLYCGKELALLKRLTRGSEFCSESHKQSYHEEYNRLALSRLLQAQTKPAKKAVLKPASVPAEEPIEKKSAPGPVRSPEPMVAVQEPEVVHVVVREPEPVPEAEPEAIPAAAAFIMPYPNVSRPDFVIGQFALEEPLVEAGAPAFPVSDRRNGTVSLGAGSLLVQEIAPSARDHHPAAPHGSVLPKSFREAHFTMDILIAANSPKGLPSAPTLTIEPVSCPPGIGSPIYTDFEVEFQTGCVFQVFGNLLLTPTGIDLPGELDEVEPGPEVSPSPEPEERVAHTPRLAFEALSRLHEELRDRDLARPGPKPEPIKEEVVEIETEAVEIEAEHDEPNQSEPLIPVVVAPVSVETLAPAPEEDEAPVKPTKVESNGPVIDRAALELLFGPPRPAAPAWQAQAQVVRQPVASVQTSDITLLDEAAPVAVATPMPEAEPEPVVVAEPEPEVAAEADPEMALIAEPEPEPEPMAEPEPELPAQPESAPAATELIPMEIRNVPPAKARLNPGFQSVVIAASQPVYPQETSLPLRPKIALGPAPKQDVAAPPKPVIPTVAVKVATPEAKPTPTPVKVAAPEAKPAPVVIVKPSKPVPAQPAKFAAETKNPPQKTVPVRPAVPQSTARNQPQPELRKETVVVKASPVSEATAVKVVTVKAPPIEKSPAVEKPPVIEKTQTAEKAPVADKPSASEKAAAQEKTVVAQTKTSATKAVPAETPARSPVPSTSFAATIDIPRLGELSEGSGFFASLTTTRKLTMAGGTIAVLALVSYLTFGSHKSASASPSGAVVEGVGPSIMMGDAGWSTDWSGESGARLGRQFSVYRPSLQLSDYRLDFQGQVESKSIGWFFRAQDVRNYYAMKLESQGYGTSSRMQLMKYVVVGGTEVQKTQMALPVTFRADANFRVKVDVRGSKFTTFVQDQKVDVWMDDQLKTGGVGFFNDRGERARIKAVQISVLTGSKEK